MTFLVRHRLASTITTAVVLLLVLPLLPPLIATLPWVIIAWCLAAAVYARSVNEKFDAGLALFVAFAFLIANAAFPDVDPATRTLRTASLTAFFLLHLVLLLGPWSRFVPRIRSWYMHRRHLGVTVFLLASLHASLVLNLVFGRDIRLSWQAIFPFFGFTALTVITVLAITSWDWWQKHVPWKVWMLIHAALLVVYLSGIFVARGLWQAGDGIPMWTTPAFVAFILFWILIAPWGIAPRVFKVLNGWKQLHVLIYVAYASLILHTYFGAALTVGPWAHVTIIALALLVFGSHAFGWYRAWHERHAAAVPEPLIEPWHDACSLSELKEGEGERVDIHGVPVALFLHQGKVRAFFGFCAHQKGPLWQGKIVQEYLVCPWHGWQYNVEDGSGLPGYPDRVPVFATRVENNRVWVRVERETACQSYSCNGCACRK